MDKEKFFNYTQEHKSFDLSYLSKIQPNFIGRKISVVYDFKILNLKLKLGLAITMGHIAGTPLPPQRRKLLYFWTTQNFYEVQLYVWVGRQFKSHKTDLDAYCSPFPRPSLTRG